MGRQKEPKSPVELYNLFHQGDEQLQSWLNARSGEEDQVILQALGSALAEPVVIFERIFASYYAAYLLADEGSDKEFFFFALTRMLGYEYEKYYLKQPKFLMESVVECVRQDPMAVAEGRYCSPSDPAGASPAARKRTYELPRYDPRNGPQMDKSVSASFDYRTSAFCESCQQVEQHDVWKVLLGGGVGVRLMFGKNSTMGKLGKRSQVSACARCGTLQML